MTDTVKYTYTKGEDENGGTIYGLFGNDKGYTYKMTSVSRVKREGQTLSLEPIQYIISITAPATPDNARPGMVFDNGQSSGDGGMVQKIFLNTNYTKSNETDYNTLLSASSNAHANDLNDEFGITGSSLVVDNNDTNLNNSNNNLVANNPNVSDNISTPNIQGTNNMFGGRNSATRSFRLNRPYGGEKRSRRIYRL